MAFKRSASTTTSAVTTTNLDKRIAAEDSIIAQEGATQSVNVSTLDPAVAIEAIQTNAAVSAKALDTNLLNNVQALTTVDSLTERAFEFSSRAGERNAALTSQAVDELSRNLESPEQQTSRRQFNFLTITVVAIAIGTTAFFVFRR